MITPKDFNRLKYELSQTCPHVNYFDLKIVNELSQTDELNIALAMLFASFEDQSRWQLSKEKTKALKSLIQMVASHTDLSKYIKEKSGMISPKKLSLDLFFKAVHKAFPNHTAFNDAGDLIHQFAIDEAVIKIATRMVRSYKHGNLIGREVTVRLGGDKAALTIGQARLPHQSYKDYVEKQIAIFHLLDNEGGVMIVAKYKKSYHVFVAAYDQALDMPDQTYFLGSIK